MLQTLLLVCISVTWTLEQNGCITRDFGNGGTVCVCNSTYCDTVLQPETTPHPELLVYTSSMDGLRFHLTTAKFQKLKSTPSDILIDSERKYQRIIGWGGAFTDSTGYNINSLPKTMQNMIFESYFSSKGLEYNLGRVPMGSTDFSPRAYTYDDGSVDTNLSKFRIAEEDLKYKIPHIQKAQKLANNQLFLFACPWSSPKWMKTNYEYHGLGFLRKAMYQPWANYFIKFLDEYYKLGINFWGISTSNQPTAAFVPLEKLESLGWWPWTLREWISKNLGPTIRNSRYSKIKIITLDDQRSFLPWYAQAILSNSTNRKYVDGIGVHWYTDGIIPPVVLTETHEIFPEKFILYTESCIANQPSGQEVLLGSWRRAEIYSDNIIQDMNNWVSGWVDWNLVLNMVGGPKHIGRNADAPIIVNADKKEFYKQPMFYSMGHFSKFVPRNSQRVHSEVLHTKIKVAAFQRPDNGTVVVILNRSTETVNVTITDVSKGSTTIKVGRKSINTIVYW